MKKHLIELADYFDKKGKHNEANVVDVFISRAQDLEAQETEIRPVRMSEEVTEEIGRGSFPEDELGSESGGDLFLKLKDSPIGAMLLEYVTNAFKVSDEGSGDGLIEVSKINQIVEEALKINGETLEGYSDMSQNSNPISPIQFRDLLMDFRDLVDNSFSPMGELDINGASELVMTLYKNFEESYLSDYMGLDSVDSDYMGYDRGVAGIPRETRPGKLKALNDRQDIHEQPWAADRSFLDPYEGEFPERWRNQLSEPEDEQP